MNSPKAFIYSTFLSLNCTLLPSILPRIVYALAKNSALMHQLLGYASHIDTCSTKAPCGALRTRLDKVKNGNFGARSCRSF
ncbi:hypothetical protein BpHYR1_028448 [Brachionus plicatilis]|uniref:Uncharacterized protein n=1 Tax=Brachionus plicatilis TaxID=10195 RepID=A0A3M7QDU5_BRAPC|nr:hypothetical protein BpHYR1_028448 [Brachionus plicatilis]